MWRWFRKKTKPEPEPVVLGPLTAALSRAWNTGETVVWREGDPIPDPGGPVIRLPDEEEP